MEFTVEQIDLLRKRANVGYKEAKEALEKCNGNVVEALAYLEEQNKIKPEGSCFKDSSFFKKCKSIISKGNKIKLIISKNDTNILNIPLTFAVVIGIISIPFTIAAIILALLLNCKIRFEKTSGEGYGINNKIEHVSTIVTTAANKITEEIKNA